MTHQPLAGYRIVELANWLAAPAAGAMLADLGADVIKIEAPNGDPWRWMQLSSLGHEGLTGQENVAFACDNRGKRSLTLNLDKAAARETLVRIIASSDVLLTNMLPKRLHKFELDYESLSSLNRKLIYAVVTGYGSHGPDSDRLGFDYAAFWARSGIMGLMGEPGGPPVMQRGGMGDHTTSLAVTTAVLAALLDRERTGRGQLVETSLLSTALWVLGLDLSAVLETRRQPQRPTYARPVNPIWNAYGTKDERLLLLVMPTYDPYWPKVARAVGRPELAEDPRYSSLAAARQASEELVELLSGAFRERTLAEWSADLDRHGVIWAPVQELPDVLEDEQVKAMGYLASYVDSSGGQATTVAAPFKMGSTEVSPAGPAPELGQNTEEVLLEVGLTWPEITSLRESGALG